MRNAKNARSAAIERNTKETRIAGALKIWPREMQEPFMRTAERLRAVGLEHALDLLVQVDHQSKTGIGSAAGNVERFLLTVGHLLQSSK